MDNNYRHRQHSSGMTVPPNNWRDKRSNELSLVDNGVVRITDPDEVVHSADFSDVDAGMVIGAVSEHGSTSQSDLVQRGTTHIPDGLQPSLQQKFLRTTHRAIKALAQQLSDIHYVRVSSKHTSCLQRGKDVRWRWLNSRKLVVPQGLPNPEGLSVFSGHCATVPTGNSVIEYATERQPVTNEELYFVDYVDGQRRAFRRSVCYKLVRDTDVPQNFAVFWETATGDNRMEVLHGCIYPTTDVELEDFENDLKGGSHVGRMAGLETTLAHRWQLCCSRIMDLSQDKYEEYEDLRSRGLKVTVEPRDVDDDNFGESTALRVTCQALHLFSLFVHSESDAAEALGLFKALQRAEQWSIALSHFAADSDLLGLVRRALKFCYRFCCSEEDAAQAACLLLVVKKMLKTTESKSLMFVLDGSLDNGYRMLTEQELQELESKISLEQWFRDPKQVELVACSGSVLFYSDPENLLRLPDSNNSELTEPVHTELSFGSISFTHLTVQQRIELLVDKTDADTTSTTVSQTSATSVTCQNTECVEVNSPVLPPAAECSYQQSKTRHQALDLVRTAARCAGRKNDGSRCGNRRFQPRPVFCHLHKSQLDTYEKFKNG